MTILVAGFSSFPGAPLNPCEALARALAGASTTSGVPVTSLVLPVEWARSWEVLLGAMEARRPEAVLLFGLHARATRLRIEVEAVNARDLGRKDAAGCEPSGPAVADGAERLPARLPISACAEHLRKAGVDFEISRDAGRYLCNDTFYRLCRYGTGGALRHFGFVHTPLTDEALDDWIAAGTLPDLCRTVPAAELHRAALALVEALAPA